MAKKKKLKKINIRLKRSEEKFHKLFEFSPVGIAMVEHETGKFVEVNEALSRFLGYSKNELLSMSFWDITPKNYETQEELQIQELNSTGQFGPNEKEYIRKDGTKVPIRISGFLLKDIDGTEFVWGIIEDITIEKENEKVMKRLALYDPLTNLANRSLLNDRFNQIKALSKRNNRRFGLMFIDLDKFKTINDLYGHYIGDLVLQHIATCIQKATRRESDIVARVGGDEFVVIIPEIDLKEELRIIADNICKAISEPFICETHRISITASIGISIYPDNGITEIELMKMADTGMYKSKNIGGNKYYFVDEE